MARAQRAPGGDGASRGVRGPPRVVVLAGAIMPGWHTVSITKRVYDMSSCYNGACGTEGPTAPGGRSVGGWGRSPRAFLPGRTACSARAHSGAAPCRASLASRDVARDVAISGKQMIISQTAFLPCSCSCAATNMTTSLWNISADGTQVGGSARDLEGQHDLPPLCSVCSLAQQGRRLRRVIRCPPTSFSISTCADRSGCTSSSAGGVPAAAAERVDAAARAHRPGHEVHVHTQGRVPAAARDELGHHGGARRLRTAGQSPSASASSPQGAPGGAAQLTCLPEMALPDVNLDWRQLSFRAAVPVAVPSPPPFFTLFVPLVAAGAGGGHHDQARPLLLRARARGAANPARLPGASRGVPPLPPDSPSAAAKVSPPPFPSCF